MPKILKRLPASIVHVSTVLPRSDLSYGDAKKAYGAGCIYGASSILALDFTPRAIPIEERKGLRDDWLALSNDFRVVKDRVQRDIAHDQLPQRSLLEHASRN